MSSLKIDTEYAPGSELPPTALTEVSINAARLVRRFVNPGRGHRKDGVHDDLLVAHATAHVDAAGAVTKAAGFSAVARIAVGHYRLTLSSQMRGATAWLCSITADWIVSVPPAVGYESLGAGGAAAKTDLQVDVFLVASNTGTLRDNGFTVDVWGVRI